MVRMLGLLGLLLPLPPPPNGYHYCAELPGTLAFVPAFPLRSEDPI